MQVWQVGQFLYDGVVYVGIEVYWVDDLQVIVLCQLGQCVVDLQEFGIEVFVLVVGDQQQVVFGQQWWQGGIELCVKFGIGINVGYCYLQGIDDGVVGDYDFFLQVFCFEVVV